MFLVKWKGLGYEHCTWEAAGFVEDAAQPIKTFKNQISIRQEAKDRLKLRSVGGSLHGSIRHVDAAPEDLDRYEETPSFLSVGCELHPYQIDGLNWLKFKWDQSENVILADEMGLGKTIQAIAFLAALWDEGVHLPHLVVVPLSTVQNWLREFEAWAPQLKVAVVIGNREARENVLKYELYVSQNLKSKKRNRRGSETKRIKCHVILTTYELASVESTHFRKIEFECLIVDEGHRLKAKGSRLVKVGPQYFTATKCMFVQELNTFECHHRTLLTGTPLQNNIQELFALLHFIDARKFDSWESFEADFAKISEEEQVKKLHGLLSPHLLRRLKKDVLKDLPPKKEQIVRLEMSESQREMYKSILARNFHLLVSEKKLESVRRGLLSVVTELRKCCAHPYLFEGVEVRTADREKELSDMIKICGKMDLLDRMLAKLKVDDNQEGTERQALIDTFNTEQGRYFVFLLSTRAGGLGINLATADTVILYDSDYNPHNDIQAQARVHRLGQDKPVMVFRLVTRLTIEERMIQLAKEKLVLEKIAVQKLGDSELKQDELDGILRYGAAELFADERLADSQGFGLTVIEMERERQKKDISSTRIIYDEEALKKLLDRSDMTMNEEDRMEVDNGELMEGFKIANFDVTEKPETEGPFWEHLLKHRSEVKEIHQKHDSVVTPGRRRRRNEVVYRLDDAESDDSMDSEYNAEGQEAEETESDDLQGDMDDLEMMTKKAKLTKSPKKPNEVSWNGEELLIHGLTNDERKTFLKMLMRYGVPIGVLDGSGTVDWSEFGRCLPDSKRSFASHYAHALLSAAQGSLPSGLKKEDLLFELKPQELMARIGMMHLFKKKLRLMANHPSKLWMSSVSATTLYNTTHWNESHDWAFVRAIVHFGQGRWKDYLKYGENQMASVLMKELKLEIPDDAAIDLSGSPMTEDEENTKKKQCKEISKGDSKLKKKNVDAKCRLWLSDRMLRLASFMSTELELQSRQFRNAQQPLHQQPIAWTSNGSLRSKYQAMVQQCFAVRACSNAVNGNQSYAQVHAAGVHFRNQMQELMHMARGLRTSLPEDANAFKKAEADARGATFRALVQSPSQAVSSSMRLDATLGTSMPQHTQSLEKKESEDSVKLDLRLGSQEPQDAAKAPEKTADTA